MGISRRNYIDGHIVTIYLVFFQEEEMAVMGWLFQHKMHLGYFFGEKGVQQCLFF